MDLQLLQYCTKCVDVPSRIATRAARPNMEVLGKRLILLQHLYCDDIMDFESNEEKYRFLSEDEEGSAWRHVIVDVMDQRNNLAGRRCMVKELGRSPLI